LWIFAVYASSIGCFGSRAGTDSPSARNKGAAIIAKSARKNILERKLQLMVPP